MTVSTFEPSAQPVSVTDAALTFFVNKAQAENRACIRLSLKTSGCTGYAYVLDYVDTPQTDDEIVSLTDDLTLAVSVDAMGIVRGTEIDFVSEGINRVVKFNNPNVISECGCGESFSVA